jgi:hypothetical protein
MTKEIDRDVKKLVNSLKPDKEHGLKTLLVSLDTAESWEQQLKDNGYIIVTVEELKRMKQIYFI